MDDYIIPQKIINPSLTKECVQIKSICNSLPLEEKIIFDCLFESFLKISIDETKKELSCGSLWNNKVKNRIMRHYRKENIMLFKTYLQEYNLDKVWKKKDIAMISKDKDRKMIVAVKLLAYVLCRQNERIKELEKIISEGDMR